MKKYDVAFNRLQESLDIDADTRPYGYYFRDISSAGAGGFHWHADEKSLLEEITNDLFAFVTTDENDGNLHDEICEGLSDIIESVTTDNADIDWNDLQDSLNTFLRPYEVTILWMGTFYGLCESDDEFAWEMREEFRERNRDDTRPIEESETNGFIEYLSSYGQE